MLVYIDGDNIPTGRWRKLVKAFNLKQPTAVLVYRLKATITDNCRELCSQLNIQLIPVIPQTKESTDIHIIYSTAIVASLRPTIRQVIVSNDKGFTALSSINPLISVLTVRTFLSWETRLLEFFKHKQASKLELITVGTISKPKKSGFSSVRSQVASSTLFTIKGKYVHLTN